MDYSELQKAIDDESVVVVAQTAPSVRVAIGEPFGAEPGTPLAGKLVGALRALGFDFVFDTTFGADVVVIEENAELEERHKNNGPFPLLNSCCPGFELYLEKNYPELREKNMASTKSPMETVGTLIKTYFAQKRGIDPKKIYSVAVMPCLIKKMEAKRQDLTLENGTAAVDCVITTAEFAQLLKDRKLVLQDCPESDFDSLMGESSGAARLFGTSGGLSEAVLRYHSHKHGAKVEPQTRELPGHESTREITFDIDGTKIRILVINGLKNAGAVLSDKELCGHYHFIEVMNCPGGCVGGAGQPPSTPEIIAKRRQGLQALDRESAYKESEENQSVHKLYEEYLGPVGGTKAKELLHAHGSKWQAK